MRELKIAETLKEFGERILSKKTALAGVALFAAAVAAGYTQDTSCCENHIRECLNDEHTHLTSDTDISLERKYGNVMLTQRENRSLRKINQTANCMKNHLDDKHKNDAVAIYTSVMLENGVPLRGSYRIHISPKFNTITWEQEKGGKGHVLGDLFIGESNTPGVQGGNVQGSGSMMFMDRVITNMDKEQVYRRMHNPLRGEINTNFKWSGLKDNRTAHEAMIINGKYEFKD
ncbi:MAG: hypothetical protein LBH16_01100 [Treponema sp.]|jgi:hypothetical protein|nr:hypothetical protein [Treponema sp.]